MTGSGLTNDLSALSDNFGYLTKGILLGFNNAITDTYIPGTTYGLFRYEKDGGGGSADTLAFLSGQIFGGTDGASDGANTPAASNHQSSFWTMLSEVDINVSGTPNYTISRLIFEPAVDHNFDGDLAPDGYFNYSYIGFHNPLSAIYSNYSYASNGTASLPSQSFYGDPDTGMFRYDANGLAFSAGGTSVVAVYSGGVFPYVDDTFDMGHASYRWDDVYATNGTINTSDIRLKEQIVPTTLGLDFINDLNPVSYKWKKKKENKLDQTHYGIIAQEVVETLKKYGINSIEEFGGITHGGEEEDYYGARYKEFVPILIKAVQELSDEVKQLKEKN